MKQYLLNWDVDKWIKQNAGTVIDIVDGVLIDNLLIETKRGYAALIERPTTEWTSAYTLYFSTDDAAYDYFYDYFKDYFDSLEGKTA